MPATINIIRTGNCHNGAYHFASLVLSDGERTPVIVDVSDGVTHGVKVTGVSCHTAAQEWPEYLTPSMGRTNLKHGRSFGRLFFNATDKLLNEWR